MKDLKQEAGVQHDSVWSMVVASTSPDEDRSRIYRTACRSIVKTLKWKDYVACMHPHPGFVGQVIGYRRLNPKDWFTFGVDDGTMRGPFKTYRHAKHALKVKRAQALEAGVYLATPEDGEHYVFTRDKAERVNLDPETLPI